MEQREIIERVQAKYSGINFPEPAFEPLHFGRREHTRIAGRKAIVDQKSGVVFGICTDEYKILRHEVVIDMIETVLNTDNDSQITVCPRLLNDGARLVMANKFMGRGHEILKGDSIVPKLEAFNSYDLSWKFSGRFGMWRLTCSNGAGVWDTFKAYAKRHLQNLFETDILESIHEGLSLFDQQAETWKRWTQTKVTAPVYEALWAELPFSKAEKEKIEALPETGSRILLPDALKQDDLSLWMMNNVFTQFASHEIKSELRKIEIEPLIARQMEKTYQTLRH